VPPTDSVKAAIALLHDKNIGSVVVSHDGNSIGGILSERDTVAGIHNLGPAMLDQPASDHMSADVASAEISALIADVMETVSAQRLRHSAVTDEGTLVGVVSVGDVLMFRMREHDMRRDALRVRG